VVFAIRKLPEEPIVIVTLSLPLHEFMDDIVTINADISYYASNEAGPLICIFDASLFVGICYSDILLWITLQKENPLGAIFDPRIRPVFIVPRGNPMAELAIRKFDRQWDMHLPCFFSLEDAVCYAGTLNEREHSSGLLI
jgi:hypothetical protein